MTERSVLLWQIKGEFGVRRARHTAGVSEPVVVSVLLLAAAAFTFGLGLVHIAMPILFDFRHAIPTDGPDLLPFCLGPIKYATTRRDVVGIAWIMNHAASYGLLSIAVADVLLALTATVDPVRTPLCLWIAGWWLVRAVSQLYVGRRRMDAGWIVLFGALAVLHVVAAFA